MKEIKIYSKAFFDKICKANDINDSTVKDRKNVFISIHNTKDNFIYTFNENHPNVLNITFDDVEVDIPSKGAFALTQKDAQIIFDFIESNKNANSFILHCTAGISRSGAVGQFIADYFEVDQQKFKNDNPHILPNSHVLKELNSIMWSKYFKI